MAFLNRIFHHGNSNYDQAPPVHMIYPAREAYQIPIDYTGTGSSQWQPQQQPYNSYPIGQQQPGMMGGMMQPQQQMGYGGGGMQPIQQGGFPGQQMSMPFGGGPMMGGGQQQQHGWPQQQHHHHQGMPQQGNMQGGGFGEPQRMVIPGQHGVLVIEGPPGQQFQLHGGPPQHQMMADGFGGHPRRF